VTKSPTATRNRSSKAASAERAAAAHSATQDTQLEEREEEDEEPGEVEEEDDALLPGDVLEGSLSLLRPPSDDPLVLPFAEAPTLLRGISNTVGRMGK
jgi:hypothetical protein